MDVKTLILSRRNPLKLKLLKNTDQFTCNIADSTTIFKHSYMMCSNTQQQENEQQYITSLHSLYSSPLLLVIKSTRMRWQEHVTARANKKCIQNSQWITKKRDLPKKNVTVIQLIKKCSAFMKPKGTLPCSSFFKH